MSTPIKRSQSTPYPLQSAGLSESQKRLPQRAASTLQLHKPHLASLYDNTQTQAYHKFGRKPRTHGALTPRDEREDAFNLPGFFPSDEGQRSWMWEADEEEVESDSEAESPSSLKTPTHISEEMARDSIRREDKLGVLALSGKCPRCPMLSSALI